MPRFTLDRAADPQQQVIELVRSLDRSELLDLYAQNLSPRMTLERDVAEQLGVSLDGARNLVRVAIDERHAADERARERRLIRHEPEPHPDDIAWGKLFDHGNAALLDRLVRAIALARGETYIEGYRRLMACAEAYREDYAARMLDGDPAVSKVLAKGDLDLRVLDAATATMEGQVRTLAQAPADAPVAPAPVEPVPMADDELRLTVLADVGEPTLDCPAGEPIGRALTEARRAFVQAQDQGLDIGDLKTFTQGWLAAVRDRVDHVATLAAQANRNAMLRAYAQWPAQHDARVLARRREEAIRLEKHAADAKAGADELRALDRRG